LAQLREPRAGLQDGLPGNIAISELGLMAILLSPSLHR
jgi:hypothetical protein